MRPSPLLLACLLAMVALVAACGGEDGESRPDTRFVPDSGSGPTVVWAVGDGDATRPAARLVRHIRRTGVDRVLYLGDVYQNGTSAEFAANYAPTYGRLAAVTAPTPGNHDWPNASEGYRPYWERALGRRPRDYYSFSAGGWEILSLNSEAPHGAGSEQVRWLRDQVDEPGTCRLAFWHRPRYSAGLRHGDQPDVAPLWDALPGHASIVVTGHEHDMQRFRPIDGITSFISGAGGHGLYRANTADPRLAFANDTAYGALRLELRPGSARFRFVTVSGRTLDSGVVRCRER